MNGAELFNLIEKELSKERMMEDAVAISNWIRYSGSEDGEKASEYILSQLKKAGLDCHSEVYDIYRSLPISGSVTVVGTDIKMEGIAAVYSGCADGLEGDLMFDTWGTKASLTKKENRERHAQFKDKIVLTNDLTYSFYYEAARAGAKGIIGIWPKSIDHHDTMGGVWGTPGNRDRDLYPFLPYIQVNLQNSQKLLELLEAGPVKVSLDIVMDNSVLPTSMPVAKIKGKTDKYILVSGHYDSWFEGMTDNGAANVMMLEMARVMKKYEGELERGVVFAWWSGHSDGRYSGSCWYFDNHYEDLRKNCMGHINLDICGCTGSNAVKLVMSGMEGNAFNDEFLAKYNTVKPRPYTNLDRNSDQTFWGVLTPISIAPSFYVDDNAAPVVAKPLITTEATMPSAFGADGPYFWWHTKYDTIDKIDVDVMYRDLLVCTELTCRYMNDTPFPVDMPGFMDEMKEYFDAFKKNLNPDFDVTPLFPLVEGVDAAVRKLAAAIPQQKDTDDIIKRVAGTLNVLKFTYSSPYEHDHAAEHAPYCAFSNACALTRENTPVDEYLFARTDFVRQRNRMAIELGNLIEMIETQFIKWGL